MSYSWFNAQGTEFVRSPLPLDDCPGISDMMHHLKYQSIIINRIVQLKASHKSEAVNKNVNGFVTTPKLFLLSDSVEFAVISAEVDSFNLLSKSIGKSDCTAQWLTLTGQSYTI